MKIICKQTTSKGFDLKEVTTVFSNDHDYNFGGYGVELDKEYLVMGIVTYTDTNCIYYLIDLNGKPNWFPYLLFRVSDNSLPSQWFAKIYGKNGNNNIYALYGFNELCNNEEFYDHLIERDGDAMKIYFKRKIELEKELEI